MKTYKKMLCALSLLGLISAPVSAKKRHAARKQRPTRAVAPVKAIAPAPEMTVEMPPAVLEEAMAKHEGNLARLGELYMRRDEATDQATREMLDTQIRELKAELSIKERMLFFWERGGRRATKRLAPRQH